MISVKKQRIAAIMVLSSVMLILLLSLNFRLWSGYYAEGDLESIVIQQMECLEKSNSENDISESICLHFYECICFGGIEIMVLWYMMALKTSDKVSFLSDRELPFAVYRFGWMIKYF